jgi:type I restriction enzyme S subunit
MAIKRERVGDVLTLERMPVEPDPTTEYVTIGARSFGRGLFHYEPRIGQQLGSLRFFEVQPDRLVISNIKGWEGAIAVSCVDDHGCLASNRFLSYAPVSDRIDVGWARWFFLSDQGLRLIQRASPGSADRNRTLSIDRFEALEIPLPPINEQRRVAWKLDRIQARVIDVTQRSIQIANLTAALGVSISARPDLSDVVKKNLGWKRTRLGSVMRQASDVVTVKADGSYPNLGIYSFGRGLFEKPNIDGARTSAKVLNLVHAGQFIYSRLFAFEGAYGFVLPAFDKCFVSNEFPTFDPDPAMLDVRWLASYLRSPDRWAELAGSSKGLGVRRQRVPVEAVLAYKVWLPPIEQQHAMVRAAESLDAVRQARVQSDQRAKSLVAAALNQAFAALAQQSEPNGRRRR